MGSGQTFLEQLKGAAASGTNFGALAAPSARELATQAVNKVDAVMALPEVTTKILAAVDNPNTTAAQLCALVSQDPSLMTRILKAVNSALFGLRGKVDSIERAVVHLGHRGVRQLAIAAGLAQAFQGRGFEGCTPKLIWMHSIAVAVTARELAKEMALPTAEEVFIAGLVHDLGLIVALQLFPQQLHSVYERAEQGAADFCDLEREIIGTDHQLLGEALAARWRFPHACLVAANYHHTPLSAMFQDREFVSTVYVADTICCKSDYGFNLTARNQTIDYAALSSIRIDQALVDRVGSKLPQLISAAASLMA